MKKRKCRFWLFICLLLVIMPYRCTKAAAIRNLSERGRVFIQNCEGLHLDAYKDQAGVWTIGWGHTGGVYSGMKITAAQAKDYFSQDMAK